MKVCSFKKGDIIDFCGEQFIVLENYGHTGKVKEVCGGTIISKFWWCYQGTECTLVKST